MHERVQGADLAVGHANLCLEQRHGYQPPAVSQGHDIDGATGQIENKPDQPVTMNGR